MTAERIQELIDEINAIIDSYIAAIVAINANPSKSFTLDTGQNQVTVSQKDVVRLQAGLNSNLALLQTLESRLNGGAIQGVPSRCT